jgi:fructose-1-phosphate kinase PfkB-like protein
MIVKPNRQEACAAIHPGSPPHDGQQAMACARELARRVKGPVFLTMGEDGIAVVTADTCERVPAPKLTGELDIVGAGDSATAGAVLALCAGAQLAEAAVVANLTASITVQQIGTTGTATQDQVRRRFEQYEEVTE